MQTRRLFFRSLMSLSSMSQAKKYPAATLVADGRVDLAYRASALTQVLVATTGENIELSGTQRIDGVTVGKDRERVLVKDQIDPTSNGIYNASVGHWTRAVDFEGNEGFVEDAVVRVARGTDNAESKWQVSTPNRSALGVAEIALTRWTPGAQGVIYQNRGPAIVRPVQSRLQEGLSIKDFGKLYSDGVHDDGAPIQAAIDEAIGLQQSGVGTFRVNMAPGRYAIGQPIFGLAFDNATRTYSHVSFALIGEARGYVSGRRTELLPQFSNLPALIVQKGRACRISGFSIVGRALRSIALPSYEQLLLDNEGDAHGSPPWWNTNGARDNRYSPHCGIIIDPFGESMRDEDQYPGLESYYTDANAGSSGIEIDRMECNGFIVGVAVGMSTNQLGDNLLVHDCCGFTCNKVALAIGQSQDRGVVFESNHVQGAETVIDALRYGAGDAPMGEWIGGVNVFCKRLFLGSGFNNPSTLRGVYAESVWQLGAWGWTGGSQNLVIDNCRIHLILNETSSGVTMQGSDTHLHAVGPVEINGGYIGFDNNYPQRWSVRNSNRITFRNVIMDGEPQLWQETFAEFKGCGLRWSSGGLSYGLSDRYTDKLENITSNTGVLAPVGTEIIDATGDGNETLFRSIGGWNLIGLEGSVSIAVSGNGTATFEATESIARLQVGDWITTLTGWTSENLDGVHGRFPGQSYTKQILGQVASINGDSGLVKLHKVAKSVRGGTYSLYLHRIPKIRPITVGSVSAGSNWITGVSPVKGWLQGDHVNHPTFPPGTVIVRISGTTFVMSQAASASGVIELFDAQLRIFEIARPEPPKAGVWIEGTIIWRTGPVSAARGQIVLGWVCSQTGAFATSRWPTFAPIYSSKSLTASVTMPPCTVHSGSATEPAAIKVADAALGDVALATFSSNLNGLQLTAYVSAADAVSYFFYNPTGSTISLPSGTIKAVVRRDD
jgi:hypothetical protein